jgi:Flp pilus assembly protein TadD
MILTTQQIEGFASLGYNLYQQGKLDDARKMFEGLTAVAPDSYYGFAGLGALALAKEPPDLSTALTNLQKASQLSPNSPSVHANLGETLLRMGKLQESAAEYRKAIDLDPEKKDPGANRARTIILGLKVVTEEAQKKSS